MDFVKTAVSYITFQRFYRYLLKRILGGFISPDFCTDQLDIQVYKGEIQLVDAQVDCQKMNELLRQGTVPFRLKSGSIGRIRLQIPWRNILQEKCKVFISGVHFILEKHDDNSGGNKPDESPQSPKKSSRAMSESARALTRLVRQVLMNVEGCVEDVIFRLVSRNSHVSLSYHISTILIHENEGKIKTFDAGMTSLILESSSNRFQLVTSYPGSVVLDIVDPQIVAINTNFSGLKICAESMQLVELIDNLLKPSLSVPTELDEFLDPAIDTDIPSIVLHPKSRRPWYEEMYSVIESEVLGSVDQVSSVPTSEPSLTDDFVIEETVEISQSTRKFRLNFSVSEFVVDVLDCKLKLFEMGIHVHPQTASPFRVTAGGHELGLVVADFIDNVSIASFDSAIEEDTEGCDFETELFDPNRSARLCLPNFSRQTETCELKILSQNLNDQSLFVACTPNAPTRIEFAQKIYLSLTPEIIVQIQSLIDQILPAFNRGSLENTTTTSNPLLMTFAKGVSVKMDLGNNHSLQLDSRGPVVVDSSDQNFFRILNGFILSSDSGSVVASSSDAVLVRNSNARKSVPEVSPPCENGPNEDDEWTSLSVPSSSIMRHIFGSTKFSGPRKLPKEPSNQSPQSVEDRNRNSANDSCRKILKSCNEYKEREIFVCFGNVEICEFRSGIEFVELQLKIQSLIDQVSIARELLIHSPVDETIQNDSLGVSVQIESLAIGPFVSLSDIAVRMVGGHVGGLARNMRISEIVRSKNFPPHDESDLIERFLNPKDAIVLTVEVSQIASSTRISATVSVNGLHGSFTPTGKFFSELEKIVQWFVPPLDLSVKGAPLITAPPRPTFTVYIVRLCDCVVEWRNVRETLGEAQIESLAVLIENFEISSGILSTVDAKKTFSGVSIRDGKMGLWLAKQIWSDENSFNVNELKQHGFRQLVCVSNACAVVKSKERKNFIDMNLGSIRFELKPDSYVGLVTFVTALLEWIGTTETRTDQHTENVSQDTIPVLNPPPLAPVNFQIQENFLESKTRGGRGGSRFAVDAKPPASPITAPAVGTARWLVDPSSVSVVYDHLVTSEGRNRRNLASKKALAKAEEIVNSDDSISFVSITISVESLRVFLVDGSDWSGNEFHLSGLGSQTSSRSNTTTSLVCFEVDKFSGAFVRTHRVGGSANPVDAGKLFSDFSATASEVRIRDGVVGSVYQCVVTPIVLGDDCGIGDFLFLHFWTTGELEKRISKAEISIQPISVSIDQDTLDFVHRFVRETTVIGVEEEGSVTGKISSCSSSGNSDARKAPSESPLFQSLSISSISFELNYRSKRLSLSRLRRGDVFQFLNLVPMIEGVRISLREVRLVDVLTGSELGNRLSELWSQDVKKSKLFRTISHVSPVRSFTNLGAGVSELINQPRKQIKRKDGNLGRGLLRGFSMFIKTLTIESLNLMDTVVSTAQGALEFAGGGSPSFVRNLDDPDDLDTDEVDDEIFEWTSVEKGARERELDPSSAIEGIYSGSDALIRGVRGGIIRGESGVSGFILKPAIGATQAVSVVLRGARSTLDSGKHRAETERKYKAPYTQDEMLGN